MPRIIGLKEDGMIDLRAEKSCFSMWCNLSHCSIPTIVDLKNIEMCEVSDAVRTLGREVPPSGARDPRPRGEKPQPSSESSQETTRLNRVTSM
jgi:hypothetical protein